jgi:hypothetical protein
MTTTKLLAITLLSMCTLSCINGQFGRTIYGNHKVKTEKRNINNLRGITVSSGIDVYFKQGDDVSVTVEADDNLLEYILTDVRDGVLHVYTEENIRDAERKRVYVTMPEVNLLKTTSAGDIIGESPVKTRKIELASSSAGDIKLNLFADEIEVNISSSGDMLLSGECNTLIAHMNSAGDLNAYDLKTKEANVSVSSAGDADINVSERLTARASSAGDINYMGNPKYIDAHSSSAGGIHKK